MKIEAPGCLIVGVCILQVSLALALLATPTYSALVESLLGGDPNRIAANLKRSPREQINKLMFHPTKIRTTSHDWTPILNIIMPRLGPIIADLRRSAVR